MACMPVSVVEVHAGYMEAGVSHTKDYPLCLCISCVTIAVHVAACTAACMIFTGMPGSCLPDMRCRRDHLGCWLPG